MVRGVIFLILLRFFYFYIHRLQFLREEEGLTTQATSRWGASYSTAPSWEKTFCISVCKVPWWKIRDAKRVMSMYKNVAEWDDSAGREAFENAKARYWAKINSLPCDLPLPDSNMYVDSVDFNFVIDREMEEEIDRCGRDRDEGIAFIKLMVPLGHEPLPATSWVEAEHSFSNWDRYVEKPFVTSGWEEARDIAPANVESGNAWGSAVGWGGESGDAVWSTQTNHFVGTNGWRNSWKQEGWRDQSWMDDSSRYQSKWKNDHDGRNNRRRNGRQLNSRFPGDANHINRRLQYSGVKNHIGYSYEKVQNGRTSHHFGSANLERADYSQDPWQHKNAVS
ncbi:hypothetical protein HPP92_014836 [Vanilla planifolia]|uniref:Uncharacterized protein n=1 Tax=Vanilla planifolia TaxID=51239 RepID=A0A835UWM6_VANPL|nr:hypothetical protein HPP92_014836 [Vanilla planifolia]